VWSDARDPTELTKTVDRAKLPLRCELVKRTTAIRTTAVSYAMKVAVVPKYRTGIRLRTIRKIKLIKGVTLKRVP
jgi:hypothetical protein